MNLFSKNRIEFHVKFFFFFFFYIHRMLTAIVYNLREVTNKERAQKRRHGARHPEGDHHDGISMGGIHLVVVYHDHHVVCHDLACDCHIKQYPLNRLYHVTFSTFHTTTTLWGWRIRILSECELFFCQKCRKDGEGERESPMTADLTDQTSRPFYVFKYQGCTFFRFKSQDCTLFRANASVTITSVARAHHDIEGINAHDV